MTIVVRSLHQPVERVLDQPLAFGVERGGRFVEQQQGRVAQQRAGDRDALALAARQARAAFAHEGVEAFGKRAQELLGIGVARRLPQLVLARVPIAVAQIVARARRRRSRVSCGTMAMRWRTSAGSASRRSTPSSRTRPALRIVEALGELEDRRLARARRPDHREPLARLHGQAEIVQRRRLAAASDSGRSHARTRARRAAARAASRARPARGCPARRRAVRDEPLRRAGGAQQVAIDFRQSCRTRRRAARRRARRRRSCRRSCGRRRRRSRPAR